MKQLELDFGVTREQACIMCHLSADCNGCCRKCKALGQNGTCNGQLCSLPFMATEKPRFETWMYLCLPTRPYGDKIRQGILTKEEIKTVHKWQKRLFPNRKI